MLCENTTSLINFTRLVTCVECSKETRFGESKLDRMVVVIVVGVRETCGGIDESLARRGCIVLKQKIMIAIIMNNSDKFFS